MKEMCNNNNNDNNNLSNLAKSVFKIIQLQRERDMAQPFWSACWHYGSLLVFLNRTFPLLRI